MTAAHDRAATTHTQTDLEQRIAHLEREADIASVKGSLAQAYYRAALLQRDVDNGLYVISDDERAFNEMESKRELFAMFATMGLLVAGPACLFIGHFAGWWL